MQNKANFRKVKLNVTKVLTKDYVQMDTWSIRKTKPIKANSKPIQSQFRRQNMLPRYTNPYYNDKNTIIDLQCRPALLFKIGPKTLCENNRVLQRFNINMSADENRKPVLVLGIGNILLRDEGVGVRVIERMQKIPLPDDVELIDGGTAGADLLDVLAERKKVIVIDAVQADCEPGTVLRFTADDLTQPDGVGMSLHELGLGQALTMTKQLGCEPKEVVVFGIKPRDISCGLELSEEIATSVPKVVELVLAEIKK
jgi:hydrogenase maturation protease